MNLQRIYILAFLLVVTGSAFAQTGSIRGSIIDDATGEALIGATAVIGGTGTGSAADVDGKFAINNLAPGSYKLQVSYVSYQTQVIENVVVKAGDVTMLNVRLKSETIGLEEVVVTAQAIRNNENALLTVQRKSSLVMDGISADLFSKNADGDAAAAMRRVTGVTVEGGKYVYVRGLGDRYSKTSLNGAEIPGLDPNKNSVQMDLFPTNLIDNLIVYKTFSPELPASFSGGYVDISTKDFPDRFTLQASGSIGYNTNATFNSDYLSHDYGSKFDLGFVDSDRSLPAAVQNGVPRLDNFSDPALANAIDRATKSFKGSYAPQTSTPSFNRSFSFSFGDQKTLFKRPFGVIAGITYQKNYEFYDNGQTGRYILSSINDEAPNAIYQFSDTRGSESVLWGALVNLSYKVTERNKIGVNLFRNQSIDGTTRYLEGTFPLFNPGREDVIQQRPLQIVERSLNGLQVKGDHSFGKSNMKADWTASFTKSYQSEPDLRFFNTVKIIENGEDQSYFSHDNNTRFPTRYFRDLDETDIDLKANFQIPVKIGAQSGSKIKFGGSYITRERNFNERIFEFPKGSAAGAYDGSIDDFFSEDNLGVLNTSAPYRYGIYVTEILNTGGSYKGEEAIPAAYAALDLQATEKLRLNAGLRYEGTDITLQNLNSSLPEDKRQAKVKANDLFPALNVTHAFTDNMNLRFGYGRTIARPSMRELANYATFDFLLDYILVGNENLKRTTIDNIDLRWEMYPSANEYLSVSAFYKNFENPIERAFNVLKVEPQDQQINFVNVGNAQVYGAEFEARKSLGFISPFLSPFRVGANVTLLHSAVEINEEELEALRVNDPGASSTRPLFGQAPFILNATFGYENLNSRTTVNVAYNVSGRKLAVVSNGVTPDVYEEPRPTLDVTFKQGITSRLSVKATGQNLLNSTYKFTQIYRDVDYIFQSYKLGQTFSLQLTYLID